jgi:hypothetical protein
MDNEDLRSKFAAPFADKDIEWRLQWASKEKSTGIAVPYVTNRAIQQRLDLSVGPENWKNEFLPWHGDKNNPAQLCGISVWIGSHSDGGEWVTKYDGAEDSEKEPVKGGLSDAMKRAAVQWGVGRYLYGMDTVYVETEKRGNDKPAIAKGERAKLDRAHGEYVAKLFGSGETGIKSGAKSTEKPAARPKAPSGSKPPKASGPAGAGTPADVDGEKKTESRENAYTVVKAVLRASVKGGNNTNLQLSDSNGELIQVFAQGENPAFVPGTELTDVKISERMSKGVKFLILEEYNILGKAA